MAFETFTGRTWRRLRGRDTWHFMPSCQHWPSDERLDELEAVERKRKPTTGELCDECQAKARRASGS